MLTKFSFNYDIFIPPESNASVNTGSKSVICIFRLAETGNPEVNKVSTDNNYEYSGLKLLVAFLMECACKA